MATLVQILIAVILSFFGMNPDAEKKMADKESTKIEAAFQIHNFLVPSEKKEHCDWECITTKRVNSDYDS